MDFDTMERCWREDADVLPPRLEEGSVMRMIEAQVTGLRGSLRRRLRREAGYYVPMMVLSVATLVAGFTLSRVLAACAMVAVFGAIIATLWRAEHRLEEAPLDRSVRDALTRLVFEVDRAGRAYLAAYVLVFLTAAVALTGFVWWRHGMGLYLAGTVAGSILGVFWSWLSGRSYVERMFRRSRAELADCLGQLESET
jgi:hypothetical protein